MATSICVRCTMLLLVCLLTCSFVAVGGKRTKEKIYIDMVSQNSCFRLLNATHQVGCSSKQEGSTGVVHYMQTADDWETILKTGTTSPYVAVLESVNFTAFNVKRLAFSGRVNGIAVISVNLTSDLSLDDSDGFSADKSCPNDGYVLYVSGYYKDEEGGCGQEWNSVGEGLMFEDLNIPIFSLTQQSDVDTIIHKCWEPFNKVGDDGKERTYPLCAMQLSSAMTAARDTQTCIRRSNLITNLNPFVFCDPLGDSNIVTTLKAVPHNETRPDKSVIVVAARMDTMSMFHNEYPSSDSSVAAIVTLLAAAKALWSVKEDIERAPSAKDIMLTFLQGEAFDYIGSSRMVYEMQGGRFPDDFSSEDEDTHVQKINLTHIAQFVELNQVGMRQDEDSLWLHVDPGVRNSTQVADLLSKLVQFGSQSGTSFRESENDLPLPPASLQRFLVEAAVNNDTLPSFVVTDHKASYTNRYYNSRLDLPAQIEANYSSDLNETERYNTNTTQSQRILSLGTALARYLFWAATDIEPTEEQLDKLQVDIEEVNHLLFCFLHDPRCDLFYTVVSPDNAQALKKNTKPFPFYVSVNLHTNQVTSLVSRILAYYTGDIVINATKDTCQVTDNDQRYQYTWMQGPLNVSSGVRDGVCYKSTIMLSLAKSPAFDIEGYDWESGQYSTWTESRWDSFKLRVFLIPSKQFQTQVLSAGVVMVIVSLVVVYILNAKSQILFTQGSISREYLFDVNS